MMCEQRAARFKELTHTVRMNVDPTGPIVREILVDGDRSTGDQARIEFAPNVVREVPILHDVHVHQFDRTTHLILLGEVTLVGFYAVLPWPHIFQKGGQEAVTDVQLLDLRDQLLFLTEIVHQEQVVGMHTALGACRG